MQNPYYDTTVPLFKKMLSNLDTLLTEGEQFAAAQNRSEDSLLQSRLAPDMFPFIKQITIASDNAKGACARLCGVEVPVMEDTETTFTELHERIAKTIAFLDTLTPEQFLGAEDRQVRLSYFPGKHFTAYDYLTQHAIPNFLFHVTTAYAILRKEGAPLGKAKFLGTLTLSDD